MNEKETWCTYHSYYYLLANINAIKEKIKTFQKNEIWRKPTPEIMLRPPSTHKNKEIVWTNQITRLPCQVSNLKKLQIFKVCYNKRHKMHVNSKALKVLGKLKLYKKTIFDQNLVIWNMCLWSFRAWFNLTIVDFILRRNYYNSVKTGRRVKYFWRQKFFY